MQSIIDFANRGGKVLGVCNGFQILCESHLLPGALLRNSNQQYICKNVHIKNAEGSVYKIPIAHGEGRYYADKKTLDLLDKNNQVLFHYCDVNGNISAEANCNGSIKNIAGICNEQRNVFGMMPHPERACSLALGNTEGRKVFNYLFAQVLESV
jgi:phosphoribosylformylglycinamidine synthase